MSNGFAAAAEAIETIYAAALEAADPEAAVVRNLVLDDDQLLVSGERIPLFGRLIVIAIGKAALAMARGATDRLGDRIAAGIVITRDDHATDASLPHFEIFEAGHPIPDERGLAATRRALELVRDCTDDDLVLALISGGGSALFEAPRSPVTLPDLARVTGLLLRAGAPIEALNAVRIPLSQVKGGGLLRAASPATVVTLILSDVLGDDPAVIASGPTVPGQASNQIALAVLDRYGLREQVPESVLTVLEQNDTETGSARRGPVALIGGNRLSVEAARNSAVALGLTPEIVWADQTGEARRRAIDWVDQCAAAPPETDCLLGGGELTVTVTGQGIGGRNTEFVLAAALELKRRGLTDWVIASLATDGQDGPTGVAGAIADFRLADRAIQTGIDPEQALADNDSLPAVRAGGRVLTPGPTGTNVNDLYVAVRTSPRER